MTPQHMWYNVQCFFWTLSIIHYSEQNTTHSIVDLFLSTNEKVGMHIYKAHYKQLTSFIGLSSILCEVLMTPSLQQRYHCFIPYCKENIPI
jgi:hypothetical protein